MDIHIINSSNKKRVPWLKKHGYYDFIIKETSHLPQESSIGERIYFLQQGLSKRPTCKTCNNEVKYDTEKRRYNEYCSRSCRNTSRVKFNISECINRYQNGESLVQISKDYQISNVSLKKQLQNNGVQIRAHSENQKIQYQKNRNNIYPYINFNKLDDIDWIIKENETRSVFDIARNIGVQPTVIFKKFAEIGYKSKIHYSSSQEKIITDILDNNNIQYQTNDTSIIPPHEIDIYIPQYQLAIEVNGVYWHSELNGKDKHYHINKTNECNKQGIDLIHIWDHEINNKIEIVKSRLLNKFNRSNKVYARKCKITRVDSNTARQFLNKNHIDGYVNSTINFALIYDNEIVSIMTFGKARFSKTDYELLRFANRTGTSVIGGASRLFKQFTRNYSGSIISYADRRWSGSNVFYEKLGFIFSHISNPNYKYTKDYIYLESRNKYQKHKLKNQLDNFESDLTEWQNMQLAGYDRIWDCGNFVFLYDENKR